MFSLLNLAELVRLGGYVIDRGLLVHLFDHLLDLPAESLSEEVVVD